MSSQVELHELSSVHIAGPVPYAVLTPANSVEAATLPLCVMLMGGGGSRQNLVDCQPLFDAWWAEGILPPMVVATPSPGMDYYLEDPNGVRWDSFLTEEFLSHLRETCRVATNRTYTAITGISIGGYGALKAGFARPDQYGVVAAMQPMLEPGLQDSEVGARNRMYHVAGGPPQLVGPARDTALFEANHPANRARAQAEIIRESGQAIYIDAAGEDFLNAHDGAEYLHRVLWDLDIAHDYHLVRDADHGGPSMRPRMRSMYAWVGAALTELRPLGAEPADEVLRKLRIQFQPLREQAAQSDPTARRRYGILPEIARVK